MASWIIMSLASKQIGTYYSGDLRMIIDIHGHVSAPAQLYAYKATLLASRGSHGRGALKFSDEQLKAVLNGTGGSEGLGAHLPLLDKHGTDFQLISPRPFQMMHSEKPAKIVHW